MSEIASERVVLVTRHLPLVDKTCPVCGHRFTGPSWRLYDAPACQKRADYARHAEKRRAARRMKYRKQTGKEPLSGELGE